jgi:membrane protease YdiL (CAAX protease family)
VRALHTRHPWIVSVACAAAFFAIALAGTPAGNRMEQALRLPTNSGVLIQQLMLAAAVALILTVLGAWTDAGFRRPVAGAALLFCLPLLIVPVYLLFRTGIAPTNATQLVMLVVFTAMIGFAEEGLFRGVMLRGFLAYGPLRAALFSSLIFGAMHVINVLYGMSIGMALLYAFYAFLLGFGFAAPYVRGGGAIWPLIIVHGLYDFLGKLGHGWGAQAQPTSNFEVVFRLAMAILIAVYGVWLIRSNRVRMPALTPSV